MTPGGPPKKVRKLVIDSGVPASLRGRVWSWLMSASMSARIPGLYAELCKKDTSGPTDEQIDHDVAKWVSSCVVHVGTDFDSLWSDHSIFYQPNSPGRADLRAVLRAYASFVPSGYSTPLCHLVGTLLIHCVAEDAFWLLSGMMDSTLKEYYVEDEQGLAVDAGVFEGVLKGSEKELSAALKEAGVKGGSMSSCFCLHAYVGGAHLGSERLLEQVVQANVHKVSTVANSAEGHGCGDRRG